MTTTVVSLTFNRFPDIARKLPQAVAEIVERAALNIESTSKAGMDASSQPSSPYQYPGVDTGTLKNSITTKPESRTVYIVSTNQDYSVFLEFGTVKMDPRPFFGQATSYVEPEFIREMRDLERRLG